MMDETPEKPLSKLGFFHSSGGSNSLSSGSLTASSTSSSSASPPTPQQQPLVTFRAKPKGSQCPFGNEVVEFQIYRGGCIWLSGPSGIGKTTLSTYIAGLSSTSTLHKLDINIEECTWHNSIPQSERCGVLFQQTTLLDALTVAGNVSVALTSCPSSSNSHTHKYTQQLKDRSLLIRKIKQLLDAVGLDYNRDASKRPTELSGGMARRASLALQLAQRKRVIVLDEPFTGLDYDTATSIAKELRNLRLQLGTALILISHEPELANIVMQNNITENNDNDKNGNNLIKQNNNDKNNHTAKITLIPPKVLSDDDKNKNQHSKNIFFGTSIWDRFIEKVIDYIGWSFPLIACTFVACGLAIGMLSADLLQRIDVTDQVVKIVEQELAPLIKMVTGEETANPMYMMVAKMKVRGMINTTMPTAKAKLYALGMAKLLVLELGPLLTALLLCGRIGGSYAGKVATMRATSQTKLLQTLGISVELWTLIPALAAALVAAPLLTVAGTAIALYLGGVVGPMYGIGTQESYQTELRDAIFPPWPKPSATLFDTIVEQSTYPPVFHLWKAITFMTITMIVAEVSARWHVQLTPRGVPGVITSSVVLASLLIIIADWGFSQWFLLRV